MVWQPTITRYWEGIDHVLLRTISVPVLALVGRNGGPHWELCWPMLCLWNRFELYDVDDSVKREHFLLAVDVERDLWNWQPPSSSDS